MEFALRILRLSRALPKTVDGRAIAGQIVRCGTSVGANYRASGRARSVREFLAKLGIVEEEADETAFWLELVIRDGMLPKKRVNDLLDEADQLVAIFAASRKTAKRQRTKAKKKIADRRSEIADESK